MNLQQSRPYAYLPGGIAIPAAASERQQWPMGKPVEILSKEYGKPLPYDNAGESNSQMETMENTQASHATGRKTMELLNQILRDATDL